MPRSEAFSHTQGNANGILSFVQRVVLLPEYTLAAAVAFRPLLANLVSSAVEELSSGRSRHTTPSDVVIAMADVLSFAPHLQRQGHAVNETKRCIFHTNSGSLLIQWIQL